MTLAQPWKNGRLTVPLRTLNQLNQIQTVRQIETDRRTHAAVHGERRKTIITEFSDQARKKINELRESQMQDIRHRVNYFSVINN